MSKPVEAIWSVEEVDDELVRCANTLKKLERGEQRDAVMDMVDRLLDRRRMLSRCARKGVALAKR